MGAYARGAAFLVDTAVIAGDVNTEFTNAIQAVQTIDDNNIENDAVRISQRVRQEGNGILTCAFPPTENVPVVGLPRELALGTSPGDVLVRRLKMGRTQIADIHLRNIAVYCQALSGTVTVQLAVSDDGVTFTAVGPSLTPEADTTVSVDEIDIPVLVDRHLYVTVTFGAVEASISGGVVTVGHTTKWVAY